MKIDTRSIQNGNLCADADAAGIANKLDAYAVKGREFSILVRRRIGQGGDVLRMIGLWHPT
jgi:hypothetical protein